MKTIEDIKAIFQEMDKQTVELEKAFKGIEKISEQLKQFSKKMKVVEDYYHGDWLEDREQLLQAKQDTFYTTGEDVIWDLSVAYHQERIKIIKQLVEEL